MARYPGNPKTRIDGTEFFYDDTGQTGPQLLGDKLEQPRQDESDNNWPLRPSLVAEAALQKDLKELNLLDRAALLDMREWIAAQPGAPQTLVANERDAKERQGRLPPDFPGNPNPGRLPNPVRHTRR